MVKCADCGFFGTRHSTTGLLVEVPYKWRAEKPELRTGRDTLYLYIPICAARAIRLHEETDERAATGIWKVSQTERDCSTQTNWHRGLTPKEHREILDRQWLLDREDRRDRTNMRSRLAEFVVAEIAIIAIIIVSRWQQQPIIQVVTSEQPAMIDEQ